VRRRNFVHNIAPDVENREADDFYPTPPEATLSLLAIERFERRIWEPACGDGAISQVLVDRGFDVVSSDLVDRGYGTPRVDFLMERKLLAPDVITNPPFKNAEQFVRHALDLGARKVAMLMRLAWLEGSARKRLFDTTPLARVHISSRRLTLLRGGDEAVRGKGSMIAFAWFVWERDAPLLTPARLHFFDWADHAPEIFAAKGFRAVAPGDDAMPLFE
jgi:hypothetical protein